MAVSADIAIDEPAGARRLAAPLGIGGSGARVIVPGAAAGEQVRIERIGAQWLLRCLADGRVQFNGEALSLEERELRNGDVLSLGDASLVVDLKPAGELGLLVRHLAGNETVAPLKPPPSRAERDDNGDVDIVAQDVSSGGVVARTAAAAAAGGQSPAALARRRSYVWIAIGTTAALLAVVFGLLTRLQRVPLDMLPNDATVRIEGALFSWQSGATLFALPGKHRLRADKPGYETLRRELLVAEQAVPTQVLRLVKLPGLITIDTGGVVGEVSVDGRPAGRVPGEIPVRAGARVFTVRAERYLDAVGRLEIEGGGVKQSLSIPLRTSWGRLAVASSTPGASVAAAELPAQPAPAIFDLPAGVHKLRIAAPGAKTWESTAIVQAGQTAKLGPILLGAPDAVLAVRSAPAGANVVAGGVFRGRTPLNVALPSGTSYDVSVNLPGYAAWSRTVATAPGERISLSAALTPVLAALTVSGEPADAELFVDGAARGKLPQTLQLTATRHTVEVRKAGLQTFSAQLDLGAGVGRTLEYRLVPEGRAANWQPPAPRVASKVAGALRLIEPTTFQMGSERREQGRRPNEAQRRVTFTRAFYIGVREVTNGEFRRFRADHRSGFIGKQSLDLDSQPVSSVSWEDAVAYCNWLSREEGLPAAYESQGGRMVLSKPATTGYRLPSEAEWEYAARWTPQGLRRYQWGNSLPLPNGIANLAGVETGNVGEALLPDYRDEYLAAAPTAKFSANTLGLHDMTGNVAEWVHDRYSSFVDTSAANDPLGPDSGRASVVRGASWRSASLSALRLAARESGESPRDDLGFRIARYAE